jgi:hypothetical protein
MLSYVATASIIFPTGTIMLDVRIAAPYLLSGKIRPGRS